VVTGPVYQYKPQFLSIPKYNFNLHPSSPLQGKAADGKAIGLTKDQTIINYKIIQPTTKK
jgi:hypothetical protein